MTLHRFHCPGLAIGVVELPREEVHHAASALRLGRGDEVELFDGVGGVARASIERATRREVTANVEKVAHVPLEIGFHLTLAVAMSKAHRQGYLVEKCTELGVSAIWPVIATRSVTRPGEAAVDKWSRRAIEAAKQSGRAWIPKVASPMHLADAISQSRDFDARLFADNQPHSQPIMQTLSPPAALNTVIAFVGPEGGWTDQERRLADEAGLVSVVLSPTVLRAETAAVAVCAVIAATSLSHAKLDLSL